jgi:hypothetical protein
MGSVKILPEGSIKIWPEDSIKGVKLDWCEA